MGAIRRTLLAVAAVATVQVATPLAAQACACGAFVGDQKVKVEQETAIVELKDGRETVTMRFAAASSATRAAWVMPVPAKAEVTLGDAELFTHLDRLSAAEDRRKSGGDKGVAAGAPSGGVTVLDQAKVGPYDVAQLAGNDATAVADWLKQNNFTLPQNLADGLKPYLGEGWSLAAVKLSAQDGGKLNGNLPPIKLSFATTKAAYPMRLSAMASNKQMLRLYVVADHKMEATSPGEGAFGLYFAGRDAAKNTYVTRYDGTWQDPSKIAKDIEFKQAADDDPFRTVIGGGSLGTGALGLAVPDNDGWQLFVWIIGGLLVVGALISVLVVGARRR